MRTSRAEAEALKRGRFDSSRLGADYKASVFVSLAAILEYTFREVGPELRSQVQARCVTAELVRVELLAVAADSAFASASNSSRSGLLERVSITKHPTLSTDDWPEHLKFADGKTIDGRSFDAIWAVLGLPGDSLPSPRHRQALDDIKKLRNRIAHGEDEAVVVGGSRTFQDVHTRIGQTTDSIELLDISLDTWLASRGWAP